MGTQAKPNRMAYPYKRPCWQGHSSKGPIRTAQNSVSQLLTRTENKSDTFNSSVLAMKPPLTLRYSFESKLLIELDFDPNFQRKSVFLD